MTDSAKQPDHLKLVTDSELEKQGDDASAAAAGASASIPVDKLVGRVLDGRYRIEAACGEGGMGTVYRAEHITLGKEIAVKVLKSEISSDPEILERFRREARSASQLGNEHIVDVSDFGEIGDGSTYFVMEFLGNGITLTEAMEATRPFPIDRTIHVARQLCRALGAAHDKNIVHRDLKPDNIFLVHRGDDDSFVKVVDFGIAKVGGANSKLTQAGKIFGTPDYMSPEQCGGNSIDGRTDIYSLGIMIYEMATGRVPFKADNLMGILTKHMYEDPQPPREAEPPVDVNPALEFIIMKCLSKSADTRYQTMQELQGDLERVASGGTVGAVIQGVERAAGVARRAQTGEQGEEDTRLSADYGDINSIPGVRKKRTVPMLLLVAALAAVGGVVGLLSGEGGGDSQGVAAVPVVPEATDAVPVPAVAETAPAEKVTASDGVGTSPAAPAQFIVTLSSEPAGAMVTDDKGNELGRTPFELARPQRGEAAIKLKLSQDGYLSEEVVITALTQKSRRVSLERKRRVTRRRASKTRQGSATSGARAVPAKPPKVAPAAPPQRTRKRKPAAGGSSREVLDPWGN